MNTWVGYTDQTQELAGNIPEAKIQEYENSMLHIAEASGTRPGLRQHRKLTAKPDFIETF